MRALALALLALASGARGQDAALADRLPLGLGVASPTALGADAPLYFFASPEADAPLDSLTVREGPHHWEIATAPPWLDPEVAGIDGDLMALRVVALRRGWAEVAVHDRDVRWPPRTMWLRREGLAIHSWPEALLDASGVTAPTPAPLYAAPEAEAGPLGVTEPGRRMHVVEVRHAWARVAYADAPEAEAGPRGWVRWHDGRRLLVRLWRR